MNLLKFSRLSPCLLVCALLLAAMFGLLAVAPAAAAGAAPKRVLFIAGPPSHGSDAHEFPAGSEFLAGALNASGLPITARVLPGWPADDAALGQADLIVLYFDGLKDHEARGRAQRLQQHQEAGRHLAVLHFALEPPEDDTALQQVLMNAIGGRFEAGWSVNPVWRLRGSPVAGHPAARGVGALDIEDEWYFHLRFRAGLRGIRPLLTAVPDASVLGEDGPRSGNPAVRAALAAGQPQILGWTCENENGTRGFGFTGAHFHRHWYDAAFRTLVLNGLVWAAGLEVPASGVPSSGPSAPRYATIDESIARGDVDDVKRHLATEPSRLNGAPGARLSPLHQAILRKQTAIALLLLERGADAEAPDNSGRTPLHLAVARTDAGMVAALLQRKVDLTKRDRIGWTPLHHAAAKDQIEIARLLLDGGADPNRLSELGGTALHEAAAGASVEMVKLLLDRGTNPAVRSKPGVTALDLAREFKNAEVIKFLEARP